MVSTSTRSHECSVQLHDTLKWRRGTVSIESVDIERIDRKNECSAVCKLTTEADTKDGNVHRSGEDKEVHNVVLEHSSSWDNQPNCQDHLIQTIEIG